MNTLYVNYTRNGQAIPDHLVEKEIFTQANYCVNDQDKQFNVSTENVLSAVRAMKLSERISCNVVLMFEGEILPMNEYCNIDKWPEGFCDYIDNWTMEIVGSQIKKARNNRILNNVIRKKYGFNIDQN
jgi:hypothetical protein